MEPQIETECLRLQDRQLLNPKQPQRVERNGEKRVEKRYPKKHEYFENKPLRKMK